MKVFASLDAVPQVPIFFVKLLSHFERKIISRMRASLGDTTGIVIMVLAIAINKSAVNVSFVMIFLSNKIFTKIIMISALV